MEYWKICGMYGFGAKQIIKTDLKTCISYSKQKPKEHRISFVIGKFCQQTTFQQTTIKQTTTDFVTMVEFFSSVLSYDKILTIIEIETVHLSVSNVPIYVNVQRVYIFLYLIYKAPAISLKVLRTPSWLFIENQYCLFAGFV